MLELEQVGAPPGSGARPEVISGNSLVCGCWAGLHGHKYAVSFDHRCPHLSQQTLPWKQPRSYLSIFSFLPYPTCPEREEPALSSGFPCLQRPQNAHVTLWKVT